MRWNWSELRIAVEDQVPHRTQEPVDRITNRPNRCTPEETMQPTSMPQHDAAALDLSTASAVHTRTTRTPHSSLALLAMACLWTGGTATGQQVESWVVHSEANEPTRLAYGQFCDTRIDYAADIDRFEFCGEINDSLWIFAQANFDGMDPGIEVYDPNAQLIATGGCGHYCSANTPLTLPATGTYTILVSDQGADESGRYILAVHRVPPHLNPPRLPYNTPILDRIDLGADLDFFAFRAVASAQLRLTQ
jgi:hypothetical protein